jgi:glycosyltransferase involved in cell wall biosynthesis
LFYDYTLAKESTLLPSPLLASQLEQELLVVSAPKQKTVPAVSIIMPVYNGGPKVVDNLRFAIKKFESLLPSFQIVVVDDGSTDGTYSLLSKLNDDRVTVIGYPANMGKGHALLYGFQYATSNKVIFADGDMQASPCDFRKNLSALDHADIVVSSKRIRGAQVTASVKRNFLSLGFNLFVKILLPVGVSDTQAGFKAFRRLSLAKILPLVSVKKYAFDVEILVAAKLLNMRVAELPAVVTLEDGFGKRHMFRMFVDLLGISYRLRLKHWYQDNISRRKSGPYKPMLRW